MEQREIKEQLFGRVLAKATGDNVASPEWLHSSLEGPHSVVHRFCRGCGLSEEFDEELFRRFAGKAGVDLGATLPHDVYVETVGCDLCDGDESVVEIKKIPSN